MSKRNANIMVFDNGGQSFDRYTVLIHNGYSGWDMFGMSTNAKSPQGFNQYCDTLLAFNPLPAWGKRVALKTLPDEVKRAIKERQAS